MVLVLDGNNIIYLIISYINYETFIMDKRIIQCNFVHYLSTAGGLCMNFLSIQSRLTDACHAQAWFNIDHRISNFFPN
ncbi:tryptophanase leader peptide [Morganella psychrotolerans]|uniref:Tryptophanase leader peptide n=1 Tax=Morganella psychrotolerans TaxID=368603 RepID=A0A5M9R2B6_9GAMM|nr:tryptophanase leader peptide [Morganella psychrotolerans]